MLTKLFRNFSKCSNLPALSPRIKGSVGIGNSSAGVCIWPIDPLLASISARPAGRSPRPRQLVSGRLLRVSAINLLGIVRGSVPKLEQEFPPLPARVQRPAHEVDAVHDVLLGGRGFVSFRLLQGCEHLSGTYCAR